MWYIHFQIISWLRTVSAYEGENSLLSITVRSAIAWCDGYTVPLVNTQTFQHMHAARMWRKIYQIFRAFMTRHGDFKLNLPPFNSKISYERVTKATHPRQGMKNNQIIPFSFSVSWCHWRDGCQYRYPLKFAAWQFPEGKLHNSKCLHANNISFWRRRRAIRSCGISWAIHSLACLKVWQLTELPLPYSVSRILYDDDDEENLNKLKKVRFCCLWIIYEHFSASCFHILSDDPWHEILTAKYLKKPNLFMLKVVVDKHLGNEFLTASFSL